MMEFVSWDDEIPNIWKFPMEKKKMFQTTNQSGFCRDTRFDIFWLSLRMWGNYKQKARLRMVWLFTIILNMGVS